MFKKCTGAPKQGIKGHLAPLSAFGKHSRNKDGLQPNCKECKRYENAHHNPKNNPKRDLSRYTESYARLRFRYKQNCPKWLTKEHKKQIKAIYAERDRLTTETGVPHDVDHIIPIQGETVSGLHVPWNLQPITSKENGEKKNSWNWERQK